KILGSLLVLVFLLIGFALNSQQDRTKLEVDFLDVGQGDAILIKTPYEQNILIDGGPSSKVLSELGKNLAFFDKKIDLVILTHPHSDHVAGLVEVLRRYNVKKVLMTGIAHTAPDYLAFVKEIADQQIPTEYANGSRDITLGQDLTLKILYPFTDLSRQKIEDLNNSSIVLKLLYKNNSFLLTGDAGELVENDLLSAKTELRAQVLKVGHHGSKYSSTEAFLDAVKPQYAIIMVGKNNDFGHPHLRTLDNLQKRKIEILRTDQSGTIKFISDGNNLQRKN
ncbi:MAG: ComEC/Rec2 family competence protein, partial [Candidatus Parcubacteria bacterium]|nr:ComEC/Rec2 family competence protein [Candidatus Parcubacteria bacterium]